MEFVSHTTKNYKQNKICRKHLEAFKNFVFVSISGKYMKYEINRTNTIVSSIPLHCHHFKVLK